MADGQRWTRRDWRTMALSAGLVVLIAALIGGAIAVVGGGSSASAVTLEPAAQVGSDPFTASVSIGPVVDFPGNVRAITVATRKTFAADPKTHTLIATATTPGLYGGTGDAHVCDPQQVVKFLQQNPQKGAAWASVLGISPSGIAAYVGSLTPVLLTSDTLVTNHGYRDGHVTTLQSVLQAGTAVMVDATGTPRVKCNCGNPLTPPEPIAPTHTRGAAWPGYAPTQVAVVQPAPKAETISVVNVTTGDVYSQPAGSSGSGGEFVVATRDTQATHTTISTSSDGNTWKAVTTLAGEVRGLTWGDGKWLAVKASPQGAGPTQVLESTNNLRSWHPVGSFPSVVNDLAFNAGQWIAVGGVVTGTDELASEFPSGAVYSSSDGHAWTRVTVVRVAPQFTSVAFGAGSWVAVGNGIHQGGEDSRSFVSKDTKHWTPAHGVDVAGQTYGQLAFSSGEWVLGGYGSMDPTNGAISLSRNGVNWTPAARVPNERIAGVAYGAGKAMAIGADSSLNYQGSTSTVFVSSDGVTWSKRGALASIADDLAFGGSATSVQPASTPPPTPTRTTPSTQSANSLTSIDWKNYTYTDQACQARGPVHLTNGVWYDPASKGSFAECSMSFVAVDYADVTGDGVADAIVSLHQSASPVIEGQSDWTTVFTASASAPVNHGYIDGPTFPPYSAAAGITIWIPHPIGTDPNCCPSEYEKDLYKYASGTGKFDSISTTYVPASELPKR